MTYGMTVGNVTRSRSNIGDTGAGFAMTKDQHDRLTKADTPVHTNVTVEAIFDGSTFALVIQASGSSHTLVGVEPDDLASEIGRVLNAVAKAQSAGRLSKSRQSDNLPTYGLNTPRSGRDSLRIR